MPDISLVPFSKAKNADDVLDLTNRALDYVMLEMGYAPDQTYVDAFFDATPPGVSQEGLMSFGVMSGDALVGIVGIAQGYEFVTDWWIGLMLLDPAFRGQGLGKQVVDQIKKDADARGILFLKLSVLRANPRGSKFWHREGFVKHRYAPATPDSDGHDRIVLKYRIKGG